jgi:AraC-like DNA-binding protein
MPEARTLFGSSDLYLGELTCAADDHTWGEDALVTHPIIALPCGPTWVVRRGTERHLVNANHAVIHQAGDEYRRERYDGRGYRCLFVFVRERSLAEIASELDPSAADADPYRLPAGLTSLDPAGFSLSRRLARYLTDESEPDGIQAADALYRVLRTIVSRTYREFASERWRSSRPATRRAHAALAEEAKEALTSRFAEHLTVEDLSRSMHVSPYHLTRVFRRHTGCGLHDYLNQLRLRAALERIRDGQDDLASLAAEVGFSSHSHLTSNFRRAFGEPPSGARTTGPAWAWASAETSRDLTVPAMEQR